MNVFKDKSTSMISVLPVYKYLSPDRVRRESGRGGSQKCDWSGRLSVKLNYSILSCFLDVDPVTQIEICTIYTKVLVCT